MGDAGRKVVRAAVAALMAGALAWAPGTPAGACSLIGPALWAPAEVDAGGTLVVTGSWFYRIEGEVGADCGGDWEQLPLEDVTVTVVYQTPDGTVAEVQPAPVTPGDEGATERYTIGPLSFEVPVNATSATVTSSADTVPVEVVVLGAPTTTVPPTTAPPATTPPPAAPVPAAPRFTG